MNNGLNGINQLNLNENRWKSRNELNHALYNLLRQWVKCVGNALFSSLNIELFFFFLSFPKMEDAKKSSEELQQTPETIFKNTYV